MPRPTKRDTARRLAALLQGEDAGEVRERTETDDRLTLFCRSRTIHTVDAALREAQVDLAVWEVERHVVNKWDTAAKVKVDGAERLTVTELWQVKVFLRRRVAKTVADATAGLVERMRAHSPKWPKAPKLARVSDPHLLYVGLHDHHFGKLAWGRETGEDYDLKIAERLYERAGEDLLRKVAGFPVERIVLPLGHDFLHIDNLTNSTTAGTPQDVDGRFAKIFEVGQAAVIRLVDYLIRFAPVEVLWVPGNHDYQSSFMLAKAVEAWFRHCPRVTVDASPRPRKRVHYGVNLIGCTHGSDEKPHALPGIMAQEWPAEWAASRSREWLVGHQHKTKETHYNTADVHDGVMVRVLPSLAGTDAWHFRRGYVGSRKTSLGLLYSHTAGFTGQFATYGAGNG